MRAAFGLLDGLLCAVSEHYHKPGFPMSSRTRRLKAEHAVGDTDRWVNAWLIASAVIAVLLLANSIRDYRSSPALFPSTRSGA